MRFSFPVVGVLLLVAGLAACDSAPGPTTGGTAPPLLSDLTFSPQLAVLDQSDDVVIEGDTARVPFTVEVDAIDPDADLAEVGYVVQAPFGGTTPVAEGTLARVTGTRYRAEATMAVPKGAVGDYTVIVYATDAAGLISNRLRGEMTFFSTGSPPVITDVVSDPAVVRPPTTFRLIATVDDPDGLANVARVELTTPNGSTVLMADDGTSVGDEVAGDGRYTARFDVPAATPGVQTFYVQAFDRTGLSSDLVPVDVTIE